MALISPTHPLPSHLPPTLHTAPFHAPPPSPPAFTSTPPTPSCRVVCCVVSFLLCVCVGDMFLFLHPHPPPPPPLHSIHSNYLSAWSRSSIHTSMYSLLTFTGMRRNARSSHLLGTTLHSHVSGFRVNLSRSLLHTSSVHTFMTRLPIRSFPPLHVEYAEGGKEYRILFIFSLLCEYTHLEYVRVHVIVQGSAGGIRYLYSCSCATGIRESLFNT